MHFFRVNGARALRLLSLTSAVLLAACGGGGGDDDSTELTLGINAENQAGVASEAGSVVTALGNGELFQLVGSLIPATTAQNVALAVQTRTTAAPRTASPAAVFAATARKFASVKRTGLALAVQTVESVDCSSGSGTITSDTPENPEVLNGEASMAATFQQCVTTLDGFGEVTIDGALKMTLSARENDTSATFLVDFIATAYSVKGTNVDTAVDGDMRYQATFSETSFTSTVSGKELAISMLEPVVVALGVEATPRMVTLRNYSQSFELVEEGTSTESTATVETNSFGELASYRVTTPEALVYTFSSEAFTAGKLKVVGVDNTTLEITAKGDGNFKVERDDNGDGSIQDTVDPVTADELDLAPGIPLPIFF